MLQWKKKVGDAVAIDEILIEVETDKVVLEVPAPAAGVLVEIVQADGATVAAEQLIARIDTEGKAGAAAPAAAAQCRRCGSCRSRARSAPPAVARPAWPCQQLPSCWPTTNLSVSAVAGTGKDGRVTKGDVLGAVAAGVQSTASVAATAQCRPGHCPRSLPQVSAPSARLGRPPRAARAHEPPARPRGRAPVAVAIDQRHPDHLQRSQHGAGDGNAQDVSRKVRKGTWRQDRLHELLRQGGGACPQEVPGAQRLGGRQRHRLPRLL